MKRTGSFLVLLFTLVSTLSYVVAAPLPSDFKVRNEVLKRSPESLQEGQLVARAPAVTRPSSKKSGHASTSTASRIHHQQTRNRLLGTSHPTPPKGLAKSKISMGTIAQAKLKLAGHKASQYPGGKRPVDGHIHAVHQYLNSPSLGHDYHGLKHAALKSAFITAPTHRGGRGGDDRKHITAIVKAHGKNPTTIHVPAPHIPGVSNQIMNVPMDEHDAADHLASTR